MKSFALPWQVLTSILEEAGHNRIEKGTKRALLARDKAGVLTCSIWILSIAESFRIG